MSPVTVAETGCLAGLLQQQMGSMWSGLPSCCHVASLVVIHQGTIGEKRHPIALPEILPIVLFPNGFQTERIVNRGLIGSGLRGMLRRIIIGPE